MKTVRRLLYGDIVASVGFITLAFMSLFYFLYFVDEIENVGKHGYTLWHAALVCLLQAPGYFYELFPITVLIGSVYSMARFAQSSEFTILRTGGLGPGRALQLLSVLGLVFAVLTFAVGDYLAPWGDREAVLMRAGFQGGLKLGSHGAWLKDRSGDASNPASERHYSVNVGRAGSQGELGDVRIFEFDREGHLLSRTEAQTAVVREADWLLRDVEHVAWPAPGGSDNTAAVHTQKLASLAWPSTLRAGVVAAALLPVSNMPTIELWRYSSHLSDQEQSAQQYSLQFWKKALYPLACIVMMALALPFAYLHPRAGGLSLRVFGGILLGISFVLLNNVASHVGLIKDWTPWLVAAAPSLIYLLLSMGAFAWLVRYR